MDNYHCEMRVYLNRDKPGQRVDLEKDIELPFNPFPGLELFFDGLGSLIINAVQYHVDTRTLHLRIFKDVPDTILYTKDFADKGFKIVLDQRERKAY